MITKMMKIAAQSNCTVLIQGESGSGKEVAARKIHNESERSQGPFIALNCGAIAKNLIESILEGAIKGAFTGAVQNQKGVVRAAHNGTLFLDEIGELPLESQSCLLRIIEERAVLPLGATEPIPVDFRLICATNRNLKEEVFEGNFREDLFYRLNVFPLQLPPLRERKDFDIIVNDIWKLFSNEQLKMQEFARLHLYSWPGNIRQLKNVLERYSLLKNHGIDLEEILQQEYEDLIPNVNHTPPWGEIQNAIILCNGNKVKAAKKLGISRSNLYLQIKKNSA